MLPLKLLEVIVEWICSGFVEFHLALGAEMYEYIFNGLREGVVVWVL